MDMDDSGVFKRLISLREHTLTLAPNRNAGFTHNTVEIMIPSALFCCHSGRLSQVW